MSALIDPRRGDLVSEYDDEHERWLRDEPREEHIVGTPMCDGINPSTLDECDDAATEILTRDGREVCLCEACYELQRAQ